MKSIDSTLQKGREMLDKLLNYVGIVLAIVLTAVVVGVILIWVIVKTLQFLAMVLIGLLLIAALVMAVYASVCHVLDKEN